MDKNNKQNLELKDFLKDIIEDFSKYSDKLILDYDHNIEIVSKEVLQNIPDDNRKKFIETLERYYSAPPKLTNVFVTDKDVQILKDIGNAYKGDGVRIPSQGEKVLLGLILYKDLSIKRREKFEIEDVASLTLLLSDMLYMYWMYKEGFLDENRMKSYLKELLKEGMESAKNPRWVKKWLFYYLLPVWSGLEERASVVEELSKVELEEKAQELAKKIIFENEENFQKTAEIMETIFKDFIKEKPKDAESWIKEEVKKFEKDEIQEVIDNEERTPKSAFDYGGVATQITKIQMVDSYIKEINKTYLEKLSRIKDNPALHGNVAEYHHAETFNLNARMLGKPYKALVLENNTPNSVDIVIKNAKGEVVGRYQSKYYKTSYETAKAFVQGNYRGQKALIPSDQLEEVNKIRVSQGRSLARDRLEYDGVSSQPLSREEAARLKEELQKRNDFLSYENVSFKTAFKGAMRDAAKVAAFVLAIKGAMRLGKVFIDWIKGKDVEFAKEFEKFIKEDLKEGASAALKTMITGGLLVAARKGFIKVFRNTPAGKIAAVVEGGFRVFALAKRLFKKEIGFREFVKEVPKELAGVAGGIYGAMEGASIGAAIGSAIPVVGTFVGGMIGAVIGGVVGESVAKKVSETIVDKVERAYTRVRDTLKSIGAGVQRVANAVFGFIFA